MRISEVPACLQSFPRSLLGGLSDIVTINHEYLARGGFFGWTAVVRLALRAPAGPFLHFICHRAVH